MVKFEDEKGVLKVDGKFVYLLEVKVARVKILGVQKMPTSVKLICWEGDDYADNLGREE
jgi:hypothetical protein